MAQRLMDHSLYAEQQALEREAQSRGIARYRRLAQEAVQRGDGAALKPAERLLVYWFSAFRRRISHEKTACSAGRPGMGRATYGPYLLKCSSAKTALIVMHEAVGLCLRQAGGVRVAELTLSIGRALNADLNFTRIRRLKRKEPKVWDELVHTDRRRFRPKAVNRIANRHEPGSRWSLKVQAALGAALVDLLIRAAKLQGESNAPESAFEQYMRYEPKKRTGYVRMSETAREIIDAGHAIRETFRPVYEPMIVCPLRWTDDQAGGYIDLETDLVKKPERHTNPETNIETVREAVNYLNATPWRVNKAVLAVVEALWDSGGNIAGLPRAEKIPKPPLPPDFNTDEKAKKIWKRKAATVHRVNLELQAERVVFRYKLDIAQRYAKREAFYFPHQLDFRGRMYPIPLFLHHQGDDLCRGLLEFAESKEPDDRGEFWLKVQMANCCGLDKVSFEQRVGWVNDNCQAIEGWADDPLTNTGWIETDKPFQALAAAMALNDPDAAKRLPIQLDGSNNALQHYGAMLRCEETAKLVNLLPTDSPADVYGEVAGRVEAIVGKDAEGGNEIAQRLEGWIGRKVVKQTVMTSPYGVTPIGARKQIYEHLKEAGFDEKELYSASRYLSRKTLAAMEQVCLAAHKAMQWLRLCGRMIAKSNRPICWTTPMGFEVEQPYRNARAIQVKTILQEIRVNERDEECPVSPLRQTNGFAPNFVHSLDASHLMCTVIAAFDSGIRVAGVHDSVWTHAVDVDDLNVILREQFILLHESPAHLTLYEELQKRYPDLDFPPPPECGELDLSAVRQSAYFFA